MSHSAMPDSIADDDEAWQPTITDPYFFDSDYTIAGSTGFLLWEANWLVLRLLRPEPNGLLAREPHKRSIDQAIPSDFPLQRHPPSCDLRRLLTGHRVLDLGSGTGLAGLCAAACGAHVLLTDLASVCEGTLRANVQRNALPAISSAATGSSREPQNALPSNTPPKAVKEAQGKGEAEEESKVEDSGLEAGHGAGPWAGAVRVGQGSAAVIALDWTEPLEPQVRAGGNDPRDADFILAVDTIWLLDIFHAFIGVVLAVLSHGQAGTTPNAAAAAPPPPSPSSDSGEDPARRHGHHRHHHQRACFLAFVERAGEESKLFIRIDTVISELQTRGCNVEVIVAEDVDVDGVMRPGRVLRVTLR
ncbi:hypothetical protein VOLCADRAFT_103609 [Volvox carteri f. nagariensis]|uniref:Methyltransferase small domain-containing protein n=1 Tax=Volvox carteri f. nagariensis TaxID=3068 RepID=D8TNB8_VOLCA|nr:uncharacterized protein VOLCADRAFT_103609 [Volvox carteri f. nagariensis]EFJ50816.1 hypothetical protein VOLCADRAFT_103609 [Volvox carteri f. nagariensis]|eukprot:XP_002947828.1 hypothetical protein VOLCADRAFT_103609 [Volvox carteri f. nagariensis]